MEEKKTEGLLLQAIPYLGNQKILKVLSRDKGLLSFFVKKKEHINLANPFLKAEWVYAKSHGDMHLIRDISCLNHFDDLRTSFHIIQIAGLIAQAILKSQYPNKKCEGLYALCTAYFEKLPLFSDPKTLLSSFYLKTLLHDGLLGIDGECEECNEKALYLGREGNHCQIHKSRECIPFSLDEWELLHLLTFARTFHILQNMKINNETHNKITALFNLLICK